MTMLFDTLASLCKFPICVPQNDTERVRVGTITDHARHDLAVGPADKFPICQCTYDNLNCQLSIPIKRCGGLEALGAVGDGTDAGGGGAVPGIVAEQVYIIQ